MQCGRGGEKKKQNGTRASSFFTITHTHAKLNYHLLVGSSLRTQSLTSYIEEKSSED